MSVNKIKKTVWITKNGGIVLLMSSQNTLNSSQLEAVNCLDGPILILAGAGAGKTRTLIERVGNLIRNGVAPSSILAITFTNKAATEMKERVEMLISSPEFERPVSSGSRPFVSTFHALGTYILRENSDLLGLPRHFSIFDRADSKQAIREVERNLDIDPKKFEPGKILSIISRAKGEGLDVEDFKEREGGEYVGKTVSLVWQGYAKILKRDRALDFDDLLSETEKLLRRGDVALRYQNIWQYIHVDEYQDTNKIQYLIANHLARQSKNICVVGDMDQNIYSWRGARLQNILDFEKDYPDVKTILLEENYRSTKKIIEIANLIIKRNIFRKEKNLYTQNSDGENLSLFEAYDESREAEFVANKCAELISFGVLPNQIAVLYRANFQSRSLEEAFLDRGVGYQLIGTKFFERREVKDALSYLRSALNPESLSDLKRIINVPPRGIGKVSLLKIAMGRTDDLGLKIKMKYQYFQNLLSKIKGKIDSEKPSEILRFIIKQSGLGEYLESGGEEEKERLENIKELVTFATRFDDTPGLEGVEKLLTEAALQSDQDELQEKRDGVKLMTVHASKGLEFEYVFIVGLEENLFPHHRSTEDNISPEDAEEERRLFYVALTRARKKLFLSYTQTRMIFGSRQVNIPSEFLLDIPDTLIKKEEENFELKGKPISTIDF